MHSFLVYQFTWTSDSANTDPQITSSTEEKTPIPGKSFLAISENKLILSDSNRSIVIGVTHCDYMAKQIKRYFQNGTVVNDKAILLKI